ncbi:MAG: DHHW family protein, partial [Lawsonibacter sp.]|nr:DHHW family protein [Lawsonibacter sp.]
LANNMSVPVYFGLIPSAATIWADRLPTGAPTADESAIIQTLYHSAKTATVDLTEALAAHSDEDLYYRTDHHWTSLGAYYGANALLDSMGLEPLDMNDYQKTAVTDQFCGTTFSSSGVRWISPDTIDRYIPADGISVTSYFSATPTQGTLYVDRFLAEKDKYSYFLGGNQSLCVIKTQQIGAPKVLIVRDSYTDSLAPFLTQRFSELHLFDLRYNLTSIKDYVAQHDIDVVVVLYSFANFMDGTNLFALGR